MTVKMTIDRVAEVVRQIKSLTGQDVLVGVPSTTAGRRDAPITNAAIGYVQEYGSPLENIPPRPFLIPGIREASDRLAAALERGARAAMRGEPDAAQRALNTAGLLAQAAVRRKITVGPFKPLAPATLAARRARGRTGTRPLIDTGQLRQSITYVIRKKG